MTEVKLVDKEKIGHTVWICRFCGVKVAPSYLAQHQMLKHQDRLYKVIEYVPQSFIEDFQESESKPSD